MELSNKENVFNSLTSEYGGILLLEHGEIDVLRGLLEWARNSLKLPNSKRHFPDIYFGCIVNPELNACAINYKGEYYIGLNLGVYSLLDRIFDLVLANKSCLTFIGDANKEIYRDKIYNANLYDFNQLMLSMDSLYVFPVDGDRKYYSQLLTTIAIKFFWAHEFSHVVFGHCDFRKEEETYALLELNHCNDNKFFKKNKLTPFDRQTLELDADSYALKIILSELYYFVINNINMPKEYQPFFKSYEDITFTCMYSLFTVFNMMAGEATDFEEMKNNTHPFQGIRQQNIIGLITTINQNNETEISQEKMLELREKTFVECQNSFNQISEKGFNYHPLDFVHQKDVYNYFVSLMNNWAKLRPMLEPFAYKELAPASPLKFL
jgi:hypothetical protein